MPKTIVFLLGSSGVGKTSITEGLVERGWQFEALSTREPRALLNNPSFEDLETNQELGRSHQEIVFSYFNTKIHQRMHMIGADGIGNGRYVFERSLFDVLGYSYAYSRTWALHGEPAEYKTWQNYQLYEARMEIAKLRWQYPSYRIKFVYVPIRRDIPYEKIDARPREHIRNDSDFKLRSLSHIMEHVILQPSPIEKYVDVIDSLYAPSSE